MRRSAVLHAGLVLAVAAASHVLSVTASAQPRPAPPPAGGTTTTLSNAPTGATVVVSDPLLDPVPPPRSFIHGWHDIVSEVRARSSDLRIAVDEIERAAGTARRSLALSL